MANVTEYSETDRERGFQALGFQGGNSRRAAADLKRLGHPIPASTLDSWKRRDPDRYAQARRQVMNHVYAEVSDELRGLARNSTNAADKFIEEADRLRVAGECAKAKQMTGAARDLAVITGISLDKSMPIDERPTEKRGQDPQADLYRFLQELERRGAIAKGSINPVLMAGSNRSNGSFVESTGEEEP